MMRSSYTLVKTVASRALFIWLQFFVTQILAQNYFPLNVGFQWEYKKEITHKNALNLLNKSSTTNLKKRVDTASKMNKSSLAGFDITVETIDTSDPDVTLYEHYTITNDPNVIEFSATNYLKVTQINGNEESS